MSVASLALLLSCAPSGAEQAADRKHYMALIADRSVVPRVAIQACADIRDADLAGDCGLHMATLEGRRADGQPDQICGEMAAGLWQEECWFIAAEFWRRRQEPERASELCLQAGRFANDCSQHLWQGEVHKLIFRLGPAGFSSTLPRASAIHARWSKHLAESTDFDQRFWAKYFQNGFERTRSVDLRYCDALDNPTHQARCESAALEMYARELRPTLARAGIDLCRPEDLLSTELSEFSRDVPDPRLDRVLVSLREQSCSIPAAEPPG